MDAKKAALVMKPIYFKDTKAFKYTNWVFAGVVSFTFLCGYLAFQLKKTRDQSLIPFASILEKYFESDEYKLRRARIHGLVPPSKENFEGIEKQSKDRNLKKNS